MGGSSSESDEETAVDKGQHLPFVQALKKAKPLRDVPWLNVWFENFGGKLLGRTPENI